MNKKITRRFLSIMLTLCMITAMLPATAQAVPKPAGTPIEEIYITGVTPPDVGKNPKPAYTLQTPNVTVNDAFYYGHAPIHDSDYIFVRGEEYYFDIILIPDENHFFPEGTRVYINGQSAILDNMDSNNNFHYRHVYIKFAPLGLEEIKRVDITAVKPEAGKTLGATTRSAISATTGVIVDPDETDWYDLTDNNKMYGDSIFEVGHLYSLKLELYEADGYYFSNDLRVYINGQRAQNNGDDVIYFFPMIVPDNARPVGNINITGLQVPVDGGAADANFNLESLPKGVELINSYWEESDSDEAVSFTKGSTYVFNVELRAEDGYYFDIGLNYESIFNPNMPTVNGRPASPSIEGFGAQSVKLEIAFIAAGKDDTIIQSINIAGLEKPVAGNLPDYTITTPAGIKAYEIQWLSSPYGSMLNPYAEFISGHEYFCMIKLAPEDGYSLGSTIVLHNGKQPIIYNYDFNYLTVNFAYIASGGGGGNNNSGGSRGTVTSVNKVDIAKDVKNGSISADLKNAKPGDAVVITPKADEGYELDKIKVTDKNGNEIKVTKNADGTYSFVMPDTQVTITAEFILMPEQSVLEGYTDVNPDDWFYKNVEYVIKNNLMVGTAPGQFSPDIETTRGMIVTILHRLAGTPDAGASGSFPDIAGSEWYAKAVVWAAENKIVSGFTDGTFGANNSLTREQLVTILYNYSKFMGYDVEEGQSLNNFSDAAYISDYAKTAMEWAVKHGIISGITTELLSPASTATRAQMAAILERYIETITK
ncbi:S-layer homology domain-containing protein [Sedimentibacter sp.]|uniref:S-layer homology domain-containing protein n=1 Tax=Sedimentibacter sp. TaxID=1960295 RepID=UPI00289D4E1F|nr:S-layer homology domain-containing protein [Sedimentibacter sp.]